MAAEARRFASPSTEIVAVTAEFGTQYVENRVEAAIASHAVLDALAKHAADCDAAIVSAFGDPGLAAAREFADIPVVGIEKSAILTAWMLGRRYSIICLTPRLRTWYIECAQEHGLAGRLASVRALDAPIADITRAKEQYRDRTDSKACMHAIEQDEAEVIIFGGGPIAGLAREAARRDPGSDLGRRELRSAYGRSACRPAAASSPERQLCPAACKTGEGAVAGTHAPHHRGDVTGDIGQRTIAFAAGPASASACRRQAATGRCRSPSPTGRRWQCPRPGSCRPASPGRAA